MNIQSLLIYLKENNIDNFLEIVENLEMSKSTLRRRLKTLEELGFIELKRGGEIRIIKDKDISMIDEYRNDLNRVGKIKIAKQAVKKIEDGDVIFIDNSTTVRYMLKYLKDKNVVVYTNGYRHIDYLKKEHTDIDIRMIPGSVRVKEASIVGEEAIIFLGSIILDKCFVGANGYEKKKGVTTPNEDEKNLKQYALREGLESYILMDSSKKDKVSKYKICNIDDYEIISF